MRLLRIALERAIDRDGLEVGEVIWRGGAQLLGFGGQALGDWTEGCIAVSNGAMDEIWALVDDGTPILINP